MSSKEQLLKLLDTEIDQLIISYDDQIVRLENNVSLLTKKIDQLTLEKNSFQDQLMKESVAKGSDQNYDLLWHLFDRLDTGITEGMIDECCLSSSVDDAVLLLVIAEKLLIDFDTEKLTYILSALANEQLVLQQNNEEVIKRFLTLISSMLIENRIVEIECDQLISNMYEFLIEMRRAPYHREIMRLLEANWEKMYENVSNLNEPKIIIKYIRMLITYGLDNALNRSLIQIVTTEWPFIDYSLMKDDFIIFFWYAYLYDLESELIERTTVGLQWLNERTSSIALYLYMKGESRKDLLTYSKKVDGFMSEEVLTAWEKDLVIKKMNIKSDDHAFSWPSTEEVTSESKEDVDGNQLKEKSALMLMGYQITGSTRSRRWEILQRAIPKLGLKRVTFTISYNIKLRKSQKNGMKKFHHAITEWEHDLKRMKQIYYKSDFRWPNT